MTQRNKLLYHTAQSVLDIGVNLLLVFGLVMGFVDIKSSIECTTSFIMSVRNGDYVTIQV